MYLFDEQPILANKALARELGLNEALVMQQINYWIEINKRSGKNYHDGKYWTYNSIRAWQENDFDYMSVDTVKRTFTKLAKAGYLLVGNYNKDPRDKTKWYTINNDKLEELFFEMNQRKMDEERRVREQKLEESMPNALGQNAPMDDGKMPQRMIADCSNAFDDFPPVHDGRILQPLPEITTKNTTEISQIISSYPSINPSQTKQSLTEEGRIEGVKKEKSYSDSLEELRNQIGYYEHLSVGNNEIAELYDQILRILADVMILQPSSLVSINQVKLPASIVQERFRQLDCSHMDYLTQLLSENKNRIYNIRAFILTASYNAPSEIDAYYTALSNFDLREGGVK
jgi:putative conjugative transposon protein